MQYFFGNSRNDRGLCATEGCTGKPAYVFVYKYCTKCAAAIVCDLECGLGITLANLRRETYKPPPQPGGAPKPPEQSMDDSVSDWSHATVHRQ